MAKIDEPAFNIRVERFALMRLFDVIFIQDGYLTYHQQREVLYNIVSQVLVRNSFSGNIQPKILPLYAAAIGKA